MSGAARRRRFGAVAIGAFALLACLLLGLHAPRLVLLSYLAAYVFFLGPALGSLHMFFHRLGPVLARRLLLTGDLESPGIEDVTNTVFGGLSTRDNKSAVRSVRMASPYAEFGRSSATSCGRFPSFWRSPNDGTRPNDVRDGAGGGNRTHTGVKPTGF